MYIPLFQEQIVGLLKPLFTTALSEWKNWTFFSKEEFWNFNIFIILASIYWFYKKLYKKDFDFITCWYLTWVIWIWLWLYFYNRFYIYFDIFIILIAWYSFWLLYKYNKKIFASVFWLFFILQSFFYYNYVNTSSYPLIDKIEFENIQKINKMIPENSILMVSNKAYSPWIAWYTNKPTIAPWLFKEDIWNFKKWSIWWTSNWKTKCDMLKDYENLNTPLYIWIWKLQKIENLDNWNCFEETNIKWEWFNLFKINFK